MEVTSTVEKLADEHLAGIKRAVACELAKRGFHAELAATQKQYKDSGATRITMTSYLFVTVPTLFEEIRVTVDGSVAQSDEHVDGIHVFLRVGVRYQHFGGGENGLELFRFDCGIQKTDFVEEMYGVSYGCTRVYNVRIS